MFDVCAGCERRGKAYEIFDWCAHCERSLCPGCMLEGCCERIPARSGQVSFKQSRGRLSWQARWLGGATVSAEPRPALPEHFGGRCCARARAVQCSCAFHWSCPSHGDRHLGSHD
ncbi:hypothetical protein [Hyalangium gracile]|uniref:hypothetical protein n=1 Tax=Hyalangium gracile TaxID=394092 RepID=UPI001CCE8BAB|nr:hypothetical protein [Hyalangium gracile]